MKYKILNNDNRILRNILFEFFVGYQSDVFKTLELNKPGNYIYVKTDASHSKILWISNSHTIDAIEVKDSDFIELFKRSGKNV